jgi:spore germination cell wall hydrolase CwlJ-like protein
MRGEHKQLFLDLTDAQIMGLCIWAEARSEGMEGRIAVGSVILNRVDHRKWDGETVHEVIMKPWQFSWLNSLPPQTYTDAQYDRCVEIARDFEAGYHEHPTLFVMLEIARNMLAGIVKRNVPSLEYHTLSVKPKWAEKLAVYKTIGAHIFYKP